MAPDHPERVAKWLAEVFCGPRLYSEQYGGYPRMISQHLGKGLTEEKRARWVQLILRAAQDAGLPDDPEFRSAFSSYIEWGSRLARRELPAGRPATRAHADAAMGLANRRRAAGRGSPRSQPTRARTPGRSGSAAGEPVSFESTSRPCSATATASRCGSPSTSGPTTMSTERPRHPRARPQRLDALRRRLAARENRRVRAVDHHRHASIAHHHGRTRSHDARPDQDPGRQRGYPPGWFASGPIAEMPGVVTPTVCHT